MVAFEPLIADGSSAAYKNASQEIQGKLRRVIEVWRQRGIFDKLILDAIDNRLEEVDKARGGGGTNGNTSKGRLGGSLFGGGSGSVPPELEGVAKAVGDLSKADASVRPAVNTANTEFAKMTDPNATVPTPPVHAARLSALMRSLATAQGAIDASIKARTEVLKGLEKLVETHRSKLAEDQATATDLATRREGVEMKKKEVEDGIMRGLSTPSSPDIPTPASAGNNNPFGQPASSKDTALDTPEAEDFTPPPPDVETFTPPPQHAPDDDVTMSGDPAPFLGSADPLEKSFTTTTGAESLDEQPPQFDEPPPAFEPPPALSLQSPDAVQKSPAVQANDFLNSLSLNAGAAMQNAAGTVRQASTELPDGGEARDPRLKRRRMNPPKKEADEDIFGGMGGVGGVDEEAIGAMLGS